MPAIHAAWSPGEIRIAVVAEGRLVDYALWRPGSPDGVGDVYRARIVSVVPAMAGAFVALDGAEGFLPDSEGAKGLTEGTVLSVRIARAAQGGKGPRVSAKVAQEDGPMGLVRQGLDPLRSLAALYPAAPVVVDDAGLAASLRNGLADRVSRVADAFGDAIETAVEALSGPEAVLESGARMTVSPTPALVAIDVDGGGALTGRDGAARRHRALNAPVVAEVARHIRLRNLSGAILVDLAGLRAKQRAAFGPAFAAALAADPARPRFVGFTGLGLAEIARPRGRAPLHEMLSGPLASGLAALRTIARAARAEPGRALALRAAPAVVAAVVADTVALADLARVTGRRLSLRADPSLAGDRWIVEDANG